MPVRLCWWVWFVPAHSENRQMKKDDGTMIEKIIHHPDRWKAGIEGVASDMPDKAQCLGPYSPGIAKQIAEELTRDGRTPDWGGIPTEVEVSKEKAEKKVARASARATQSALDL